MEVFMDITMRIISSSISAIIAGIVLDIYHKHVR